MEEFGQSTTDLDSGLIDEIVCKVKSEGLFDQFRRECLADVDTKPAYQNLQHRVESAVSLFLDEQTWSSQLNKNQLREKLRKLTTEKRFFEAGIERIIDQVVIPKLNTNFVPKIEDVAYKLLGLEKPLLNIKKELEIDADVLLPNYELEQVSPESEKSHSNESKCNTYETSLKYDMHEELDGKNEDLESPAFEPIEPCSDKIFKTESTELMDNDDMDISDGDDGEQINGFNNSNADEVKSNLSSISGLTSNDSNSSSFDNFKVTTENHTSIDVNDGNTNVTNVVPQEKSIQSTENHVAPEITIGCAERLPLSENIISNNMSFNQDSMLSQDQLSQVSSSSRLSIVTNNNTNTQVGDVEYESNVAIDETSHVNVPKHTTQTVCPYGISEEAQMQKFNESSSSSNSLVIETDNMDVQPCASEKKVLVTSFDIKREEIKFQGTERKFYDISTNRENDNKEDNGKGYDEDDTKTGAAFDSQQIADSNHESNEEDTSKESKLMSNSFEENQEDMQPSSSQSYNDDDSNTFRRQKDKHHHKSQSHDDGRKNSTEDIDSKSNSRRSRHRNSSKRDVDNDKRDRKHNESPHSSLDRKKTLKNDKNSSKQKDRTESHRSSCHKDKATSRQRSRSKDSNDGFAHPNVQGSFNCNETNIVNQGQTTANSSNDGDHVTTTSEGTTNANDSKQSTDMLDAVHENQPFELSHQYAEHEKSMISNSPVVIDQILTGNELDLKSFIGDNRDDPIVSSIEQSLEIKEKKPKVADNFEDAKRMRKIRKQIELKNQKQIEKATVLAKQYIASNASTVRDDTKGGIELEFVCSENKKGINITGPIISSPINYINGKSLLTSTLTSTLIATMKTDEITSPANKFKFDDDKELIGFDTTEIEFAEKCHQHFLSINIALGKCSTKPVSISSQRMANDKQNHIHENSKDFNDVELTKPCNRKRKADANNTQPDPKSSTVRDDEVLLANVFISKTSRECNFKSDATRIDDQISTKSSIEKQRQKTRYSNDDLFKPRPLLGGVSRRRRGFNCNE
ncbi:biorientation of chromosomes in cell division protein 1-like 1 [Contarinia nasturtii]|uniref:biorientation of chromosomes in cell division protein 1-like 1 n=1 Tax=Contarinia nasturtii TaxID=265458 RepID=UPI0012D3E7C6|nr:biorientation of chromosomes in cell division protein 1-like 1 [Contarinia nasturtii]